MGQDVANGGVDNRYPNLLFIVTDQQQSQALGAVDPSFETPNIDRLVQDGTLFKNCYCTYPQCSPSRSSLVTGCYPHQTGVYMNSSWGAYDLSPSQPSVGREFRDAGYETAWIGKWHLGEDNLGPLGWETRVLETEYGIDDEDGYSDIDERTSEETCSFLREYDGSRPFFATASFKLPHPPWYESEEYAELYNVEEMELPENYDDDLEGKPSVHRKRAAMPECERSESDTRRIQYLYRTMVSEVDAHIGRVLDTLHSEDLAQDTIIVFTSDHGDMQVSHGLPRKGGVAYEEVLAVPLVIRFPDDHPQPDIVDDLVSNASIPATLLDMAGLSVPDAFEAESILPSMVRPAQPADDHVFFEHKFANWGHHPFRGVRTQEWKYVEYQCDSPNELYHLETDPGEMTNLVGRVEHTEVQQQLTGLLEEWWAETGGDDIAWVESAIPE